MMAAMTSAKAKTRTALTDFLSVPKIIEMGPIMITPAALTLPFAAPRVEAAIMAATMTTIPATINAAPSANKADGSKRFSS